MSSLLPPPAAPPPPPEEVDRPATSTRASNQQSRPTRRVPRYRVRLLSPSDTCDMGRCGSYTCCRRWARNTRVAPSTSSSVPAPTSSPPATPVDAMISTRLGNSDDTDDTNSLTVIAFSPALRAASRLPRSLVTSTTSGADGDSSSSSSSESCITCDAKCVRYLALRPPQSSG